ncbi:hypothetical protein [Naasia aerilata]|uniref:Uncharacterized protein n=1 Tax=Naasia aerilata TaxID=1162966 RepID=A0ABM8G8P2_9MICO|nr:hypothetical protein [Naasia aerilata]BDZ44553.1 hypothetical protein GCM10025866_04620 [Naasia aerilata]
MTTPTDLREASFRPVRPQRRDPGGIGWILVTIGLTLVALLAISPSGYVIEQPGPVYDTLGSVGSGDDATPLIRIPGEETYETTGSLDLLTVSVTGSPTRAPDLLQVALAWFDRTKSVQPLEAVFPPGTTTEQRDQQARLQMQNSQQEAVAAALTELGYDIPRELTVQSIQSGAPAEDSWRRAIRSSRSTARRPTTCPRSAGRSPRTARPSPPRSASCATGNRAPST